MKKLVGGILTVALLGLVGCTNESVPGGPGASTPAAHTDPVTDATTPAANNTFTLKVPAVDTNVEQSEDEEITLWIDRDDNFTQSVKVTFETSAGVTVTPSAVNVPAGQEEFKVLVGADASTAVGKAEIKVTATPETGKAVAETFKIDVTKASEGASPPATPETPTEAPADTPADAPANP